MYKGYAKLHRTSTENELYFAEPFNKWHARQDLFLHANFKPKTIFIRGHEIKLKAGQLGRSEVTMSSRWKRSRGKVRRFLKRLETRQQIVQQKNHSTTIITIINYNKYQLNDTTDDTTERQQKDNGGYTTKNVKKEKNISICKDSKKKFIKTKKDIKEIMPVEIIKENKHIFTCLWYMIEAGLEIEKKEIEINKFIKWIKEKAKIYGYYTPTGDMSYGDMIESFDRRFERHKDRDFKKVKNHKSSVLQFLKKK